MIRLALAYVCGVMTLAAVIVGLCCVKYRDEVRRG